MIRVSVRDTANNGFAWGEYETTDQAIAAVSEWVQDGFRVLVIPIVEEEICGETSPTSAFVCNLALGHSGDHRDVAPSGGLVGWSA